MKILPIFVAALVIWCAACQRTPAPMVAAPPVSNDSSSGVSLAESASISANPNPIVHGPEEGTTEIAWDMHGNGTGQVYVSRNGAPEQLFASGKSGTQTVHWIRTGLNYEFLLYQSPSHELLTQVKVTHQR